MRTLLIDNHDSFTFNLYQLLVVVNGEAPVVVRNDGASWDELAGGGFDSIVISPGPGRPEVPRDLGVSRAAIERSEVPLLGVCLGLQGIAWLAGGQVVRGEPVHGRASAVRHDGSALFAGIPQGFAAVRYHSLVVDPGLPDPLEAIAWTGDGVVMGLRHRRRPQWGVQFHPESVASEHGRRLLENFRDLAARHAAERRGGEAGRGAAGTAGAARMATLPAVVPGGRARVGRREGLSLVWRRIDRWVDPERVHAACYRDSPCSFWLDSSLVAPGGSRFSFMGDDRGPLAMRVEHDVERGEVTVARGGATAITRQGLFDLLRGELAARWVSDDRLPFDFQSGFVGYLGYEMKAACGAAAGHESPLPDAWLLFADRLIAFDHVERAIYLVCLADQAVAAAGPAAAERWLTGTASRLRAIAGAGAAAGAAAEGEPAADRLGGPIPVALDRDPARYLADIEECLEQIRAGESYEVCLTNQLRARTAVDGARLHAALRRLNPAPYAALLRFPGLDVVSSSPERFLRIDRGGRVESRPIKGTRPRGATPDEDAALAAELRASEKDRSENLMIVDLVRNDLGVVCEPGSVEVTAMMEVETYAGVHQLVSAVGGQLRGDVDALDCVEHAFPPGSMTGAPRQRTMEILDRLEGAARGVYSGAIGFLGANGAADLAVVIRTAVIHGGEVTIGVGGAVVALSDPAAELDEMLLKGRELVRAVERVAGADTATSRARRGAG